MLNTALPSSDTTQSSEGASRPIKPDKRPCSRFGLTHPPAGRAQGLVWVSPPQGSSAHSRLPTGSFWKRNGTNGGGKTYSWVCFFFPFPIFLPVPILFTSVKIYLQTSAFEYSSHFPSSPIFSRKRHIFCFYFLLHLLMTCVASSLCHMLGLHYFCLSISFSMYSALRSL